MPPAPDSTPFTTMAPWFLLWAPYYAPLSGQVQQAFSLDAFFGSIAPAAGDGNIERAVFSYASYGRQIGMLSDVVAILLDKAGLSSTEHEKALETTPEENKETIDRFVKIYNGVNEIKHTFMESQIDTINRILPNLKTDDLKAVESIVQAELKRR